MLIFSTILDVNDSMTKDAFIRLVIDWNQGSPHVENVIQGIEWHGERNIRYGDEAMWLAIEEYRNENIIAVRYEKRENDGTVWDTDYVMNFNLMKMSVRLDRSYTADALDINPKFSTPHLITLLIDRGYLKDDHGLQVKRTELDINEENVDLIIDVINNISNYNLPIVYISKTCYNENPVDVSKLANRLKGLAHVMAQDGIELNKLIRTKCEDKNEYHGAIGIYFPKRGMNHRKFLYRRVTGIDEFLQEKVFLTVIRYSNEQMVDTLFTWQGVNNALLRDRLVSQREERFAAEKARKSAEAEIAKIVEDFDEKEKEIRKKAFEDAQKKIENAQNEVNNLLDNFDDDMQKLHAQVEELTRQNESLQYENMGLKAKLDSMESVPVLYVGEENDFYPGEIKDLLLATLSDAVKGIQAHTRRSDVVIDIIKNNDYQEISASKADELKKLLNNYTGMTPKIRQTLKDLGFDITEEGKHYKVTYFGDERYQTSYSKTPSDVRTGKNCALQTIKMVF